MTSLEKCVELFGARAAKVMQKPGFGKTEEQNANASYGSGRASTIPNRGIWIDNFQKLREIAPEQCKDAAAKKSHPNASGVGVRYVAADPMVDGLQTDAIRCKVEHSRFDRDVGALNAIVPQGRPEASWRADRT